MGIYVARRLIQAVPLLLGISVISFLILKADYLFANHSSESERPGIRSSLSLLF